MESNLKKGPKMSYKYTVIKEGPAHYVLPKTGDMNCEVHAFLSEKLYNMTDEGTWQQAVDSASYEGVTDVILQPDCHRGYGIPIGGVVITDGTIIQSGSGYDISCGCCSVKVEDMHASDLADPETRRQWVEFLEKRIGMGVGQGSHRKGLTEAKVEEILRYGAQAIGVDSSICERQYIPVPENMDLKAIQKARGRAADQLGSLGGGNHFLELQVDEKDGSVWVMIHCGSRGYGWQTANHFFHAGAELRGLAKNRREQSHLYADEPLGQEYWAYHNSAANYAIVNRHMIVKDVFDVVQEVWDKKCVVDYEISHNLVQEESVRLPDGTWRKGFVHRKGSTRAFPAGHEDLKGTKWEKTGHPCLIPGSMYHGAAVLFPLEGAYKSGCSVNHGSGRVMARGEARRELAKDQLEINRSMAEVERVLGGVSVKGIVTNHNDVPLDECAHVYKDLDDVLGVLEENDIARVARRLYPVANMKGL